MVLRLAASPKHSAKRRSASPAEMESRPRRVAIRANAAERLRKNTIGEDAEIAAVPTTVGVVARHGVTGAAVAIVIAVIAIVIVATVIVATVIVATATVAIVIVTGAAVTSVLHVPTGRTGATVVIATIAVAEDNGAIAARTRSAEAEVAVVTTVVAKKTAAVTEIAKSAAQRSTRAGPNTWPLMTRTRRISMA